jgi:hypothetical protein
VYKGNSQGILEFWERAEKEWSNIPASVCQNLIESMPSTNAMLFSVSNKMLQNLSNETTPKKIIFQVQKWELHIDQDSVEGGVCYIIFS